MEITLTEINKNELQKLNDFLENNELNVQEFNELTKTINFSFSVENCSRLLSHHICESLDSYTQQSQRYVKMGNEAFVIPKEIEKSDLKEEYEKLNLDLFKFYNKITQIKEGFAGRKASEQDYVYGIKIEDGRYVLPLATKTNIIVTMNLSKTINFFNTIKKAKINEGEELLEKIKELLGKNISKFIEKNLSEFDSGKVNDFVQEYFNKIDSKNNCALLNKFEEPLIRSGLGALTSTNEIGASKIKEKWDEKNEAIEKAKAVTERVIGYGHTSIIEHARTNFGMQMSLTCYHQFERHRLPNNIREEFSNLPLDREVIMPPSVEKNQEINKEFMEKVQMVKEFRKKMNEKNLPQEYLLLNCDILKLISSTNARIDNEILAERTCNNAQWEIRDLYTKKLEQLQKTAKVLYDKAGPPCTKGTCPEGALSCGKIIEVRKKFGYFGK